MFIVCLTLFVLSIVACTAFLGMDEEATSKVRSPSGVHRPGKRS
jgi:hypothetical protein